MDKYSRFHDNQGTDTWADEILDFLYDHGLCDKAMAWALGVQGDYDRDYMQRVFEALPEYKNDRNITQEEIAGSYKDGRKRRLGRAEKGCHRHPGRSARCHR